MAEEIENNETKSLISKMVIGARNLADLPRELDIYQEKLGTFMLKRAAKRLAQMKLLRTNSLIILNESYRSFNQAYEEIRAKWNKGTPEASSEVVSGLQKLLDDSEAYFSKLIESDREYDSTKVEIHPDVQGVVNDMSEQDNARYASPL